MSDSAHTFNVSDFFKFSHVIVTSLAKPGNLIDFVIIRFIFLCLTIFSTLPVYKCIR